MDHSQPPPDADNRKGDAARRASLRLRDAEAVATTRRDMFGDGSLIDALTARDEAAASAEPASAPEGPYAAEMPGAQEEAQGEQPGDPDASAAPAQSLDAIIDSFPADAALQASAEAAQGDPAFLATSRFALLDRDNAAPAGGEGDAPDRFQVSAIFAGLSSPEAQGEVAGSSPDPATGNAPLMEAAPDLPADAADGDTDGAAAEPRQGASGLGVPLFSQPPAGSKGDDDDGPPAMAPFPEPADWAPMPETGEAEHPAQSPVFGQAPENGGTEPYPLPAGWPPFMEPPGAQMDPDAPPLQPPTLITAPEPTTGAPDSPFPAPPPWPPFPDGPDAGDDQSAPSVSGLPPYFELPAHPGVEDARPMDPLEAADEAPPPADTSGFMPPPPSFSLRGAYAGAAALPDGPRFEEIAGDQPPAGGPGRGEASAKIAAEADATAQALDNLQRLLSQTITPAAPSPQPAPQPVYAPASQQRRLPSMQMHLPPDDSDPFAHEMAPMLPLPMPAPEPDSGRNIYLLGFFTGLVLSVMAGAALYFLINAG